ncbi:unnamed protein product [Lactuca virosa]|uniref:Uncharacterized protein n=1 Tax=Lactuca virosa TaxID=75947 RepID=A0AAU9NR73_9ASTR|nr:unnamed protein product [Lactuca virosa]
MCQERKVSTATLALTYLPTSLSSPFSTALFFSCDQQASSTHYFSSTHRSDLLPHFIGNVPTCLLIKNISLELVIPEYIKQLHPTLYRAAGLGIGLGGQSYSQFRVFPSKSTKIVRSVPNHQNRFWWVISHFRDNSDNSTPHLLPRRLQRLKNPSRLFNFKKFLTSIF